MVQDGFDLLVDGHVGFELVGTSIKVLMFGLGFRDEASGVAGDVGESTGCVGRRGCGSRGGCRKRVNEI